MPAYEKTIRDNLALHLDVLEPGLQLIATEHSLANAHGTKGFIDILAKDALGNRVVIELKRSNQSARQALHEIFKYSALSRSREGLPYGKIRCFVVSTEWHELRVPFAEFIRVSDSQCEGFELSVDNEGKILEATKHEPVELPEPLDLFYLHSAFLFHEAPARDEAVQAIVDAFKTVGGLGCISRRVSTI